MDAASLRSNMANMTSNKFFRESGRRWPEVVGEPGPTFLSQGHDFAAAKSDSALSCSVSSGYPNQLLVQYPLFDSQQIGRYESLCGRDVPVLLTPQGCSGASMLATAEQYEKQTRFGTYVDQPTTGTYYTSYGPVSGHESVLRGLHGGDDLICQSQTFMPCTQQQQTNTPLKSSLSGSVLPGGPVAPQYIMTDTHRYPLLPSYMLSSNPAGNMFELFPSHSDSPDNSDIISPSHSTATAILPPPPPPPSSTVNNNNTSSSTKLSRAAPPMLDVSLWFYSSTSSPREGTQEDSLIMDKQFSNYGGMLQQHNTVQQSQQAASSAAAAVYRMARSLSLDSSANGIMISPPSHHLNNTTIMSPLAITQQQHQQHQQQQQQQQQQLLQQLSAAPVHDISPWFYSSSPREGDAATADSPDDSFAIDQQCNTYNDIILQQTSQQSMPASSAAGFRMQRSLSLSALMPQPHFGSAISLQSPDAINTLPSHFSPPVSSYGFPMTKTSRVLSVPSLSLADQPQPSPASTMSHPSPLSGSPLSEIQSNQLVASNRIRSLSEESHHMKFTGPDRRSPIAQVKFTGRAVIVSPSHNSISLSPNISENHTPTETLIASSSSSSSSIHLKAGVDCTISPESCRKAKAQQTRKRQGSYDGAFKENTSVLTNRKRFLSEESAEVHQSLNTDVNNQRQSIEGSSLKRSSPIGSRVGPMSTSSSSSSAGSSLKPSQGVLNRPQPTTNQRKSSTDMVPSSSVTSSSVTSSLVTSSADSGIVEHDFGKPSLLSKAQRQALEEAFSKDHTLKKERAEKIAKGLHLSARKVIVWFENKRQRKRKEQLLAKFKQTEAELKRLSEQNQKMEQTLTFLHNVLREIGYVPPGFSSDDFSIQNLLNKQVPSSSCSSSAPDSSD